MIESRFYKIVMTVELDPNDHDARTEDLYMIGRRAEKAIDNNTDMIAWILSVEPSPNNGRDGIGS